VSLAHAVAPYEGLRRAPPSARGAMEYGGEAMLAGSGNVYAEAFAFRLLVRHLRAVSGEASNIDIMGASGMCRNCVAKWYHAGTHASGRGVSYEEACEYVYGESYGSWKKKYQVPARPEQLERFEATKPWHAKHEKSVEAWAARVTSAAEPCCYEDEGGEVPREEQPEIAAAVRLGVLTVSDRASAGVYDDASGPAVVDEARRHAKLDALTTAIVPDERDRIEDTLRSWATTCDLVLTTGGTGFGPRDVTPEATAAILDKQAPGLIHMVHARALAQPDHDASLLSRAVAGLRGSCLVVNLPGRPQAARRNLGVLMPTLLKAVAATAAPPRADHASAPPPR